MKNFHPLRTKTENAQKPAEAEGRERGPLRPGSAFSQVTSFHLRLGQAGAGRSPAAAGTKSAGLPGKRPPSAARRLPTSRGQYRPHAEANGLRAANTCEGRLRPAGLLPPLRAGPLPPIVTARPAPRPARQGHRPLASSPPEPGFRLRRCHGASFLLAPSHGPRQETTAPRPALKQSASASEAPSSLPSVPTAPASGDPPASCSCTRGRPAPLHPASVLADRHRPRRRSS